MKEHFSNILHDHKDYANLIIVKNFLEPIGLKTDSSLHDGRKSENSDWERDVLNLKKYGAKIAKNLFFRTTLLVLFNNWESKCPQIPKMRVYLKEKFEYNVQTKYLFEKTSLSVGKI